MKIPEISGSLYIEFYMVLVEAPLTHKVLRAKESLVSRVYTVVGKTAQVGDTLVIVRKCIIERIRALPYQIAQGCILERLETVNLVFDTSAADILNAWDGTESAEHIKNRKQFSGDLRSVPVDVRFVRDPYLPFMPWREEKGIEKIKALAMARSMRNDRRGVDTEKLIDYLVKQL